LSKQTVATLLLTLLVTNYLSFQAGQTLLYYKEGARPSRTGAGASGSRVYGVNQVLRFSPTRIDFGTIEGKEVQVRQVSFENPTQDTVTIKQVKASCSCTTAIVDSQQIPAKGKGQLTIAVNPATASTELAISVSVEYVGKPQVDRLLVSGQVIK
jgi:hypothetical protein